jgi:hypothetical protein
MKKCLVAICISFVLAASAAVADGILSGYVRTSSGQPVPYDQVTWGEFCGPEQSHTFTDINGYWRTPDNNHLSNGFYSVGAGPGGVGCAQNAYLCANPIEIKGAGSNPEIVTGVNFTHGRFSIDARVVGEGSMSVQFGDRPPPLSPPAPAR